MQDSATRAFIAAINCFDAPIENFGNGYVDKSMTPPNDVTCQRQTDPALKRLVRTGNMGVLLSARILALSEDSGASKVEVLAALGAVEKLLVCPAYFFRCRMRYLVLLLMLLTAFRIRVKVCAML